MAQDQVSIKLFPKGEYKVEDLSHESVVEYLQATKTAARIASYIIEPIEESLKNNLEGEIYSDNGIYLGTKSQVQKQKQSPKEVSSIIEDVLSLYQFQNSIGIRQDGVKKFNGNLGVDSNHLKHLIKKAESKIINETVNKKITYDAQNLDGLLTQNVPRLAFASGEYQVDSNEVKKEDAQIYIAAKNMHELLTSQIINPFEKEIKKQTNPNDIETTFETFDYKDLSVQVKSVPRKQCDYSSVVGIVKYNLDRISKLNSFDSKQGMCYYNDERNQPRIYTDINYLKDLIDFRKQKKNTITRQEIRVLYKPDNSLVLVR